MNFEAAVVPALSGMLVSLLLVVVATMASIMTRTKDQMWHEFFSLVRDFFNFSLMVFTVLVIGICLFDIGLRAFK